MNGIWATASGWEYDLLRSLSPETATTLLQNATRRGFPALVINPWFLLTGFLIAFTVTLTWVVAQMLGWGWTVRFLLETVVLHKLFLPLFKVGGPRLLKPFVRDELLRFARSEFRRAARCDHVRGTVA